MRRALNIQGRIGIFDDNELAIWLSFFQIFVEAGIEITSPQIIILAFRLSIGEQRGIENHEAGMRCIVFPTIFEQTNAERRLRDGSQALSIRNTIFAVDNEVA